MLGDVLALARQRSDGFDRWLRAADPRLSADLARAAAHEGLTAAEFGRAALAGFSRRASEDDWSKVLREVRDASDPGLACLTIILRWQLTHSTAAWRATS